MRIHATSYPVPTAPRRSRSRGGRRSPPRASCRRRSARRAAGGRSGTPAASAGGGGRRPYETESHERLGRDAFEGRTPGQELVGEESEAVHVGARRHLAALDAFRRDVARGAQELLVVAIARRAGDAEVGELDQAR